MNTITLPAHFDGTQIRLDVPFQMKPNTRLIVTVLPETETDQERKIWSELSTEGLSRAYSDDEPDYPIDLIKEANVDYAGADVILTPIPQADGTVKNRPAVVLRALPPFQDLLICGISTQLRHEAKGFDEIIAVGDNDYVGSGLVSTSLIRLGFLAVLPSSKIVGKIGSISAARHQRLLKNLSEYLAP